VALVFISAIASTHNESVLSAPQVFWIRLILDTFMAISIIIEIKPEKGLRPERCEPCITTRFTWAMMLGQATFQLTALLILYYAGPSIFRYTSNHGLALKTLVFNTFMWMQVLNLLK
jgi:Ca2+-transporting ATPase